jgi:hypothetical protein
MTVARHRNQAVYILPWCSTAFVTFFDMQQDFTILNIILHSYWSTLLKIAWQLSWTCYNQKKLSILLSSIYEIMTYQKSYTLETPCVQHWTANGFTRWVTLLYSALEQAKYQVNQFDTRRRRKSFWYNALVDCWRVSDVTEELPLFSESRNVLRLHRPWKCNKKSPPKGL